MEEIMVLIGDMSPRKVIGTYGYTNSSYEKILESEGGKTESLLYENRPGKRGNCYHFLNVSNPPIDATTVYKSVGKTVASNGQSMEVNEVFPRRIGSIQGNIPGVIGEREEEVWGNILRRDNPIFRGMHYNSGRVVQQIGRQVDLDSIRYLYPD